MYPLLDHTTMTRRAGEARQHAAAARAADGARARPARKTRVPQGLRHALGASLVRAGLRLIHT
jgi:hypothetical protein